MLKIALFLSLMVALPASAADETTFKLDKKPVRRSVKIMLEAERNAELADRAFDAMFKVAVKELRDRGHKEEGDRLEDEWTNQWQGALVRMGDMGDHAPINAWVAIWYMALRQLLGDNLLESTHLADLNTLNFTIPVVFRPEEGTTWCTENIQSHPDDTCAAEYRRHLAGTKFFGQDPYATARLHHGFSGIVAYWSAWTACQIATLGMGWYVICSPAGSAVEWGIEKFVAPKLAGAVWARHNH